MKEKGHHLIVELDRDGVLLPGHPGHLQSNLYSVDSCHPGAELSLGSVHPQAVLVVHCVYVGEQPVICDDALSICLSLDGAEANLHPQIFRSNINSSWNILVRKPN